MIYETFQDYALRHMALIVDKQIVTNPKVLGMTINIIDRIAPNAVFCTIMGIDKNEIIFYWKAGDESLEISVEDFPSLFGEADKDTVFTRHTKGLTTQAFELTFEQVNEDYYTFLNSVLVPMVERVNELNPDWKNLFA